MAKRPLHSSGAAASDVRPDRGDRSHASWRDLPAQVADAERFLKIHRREIERLAQTPGVTDLTLDFPVESRMGGGDGVVAQFDRFAATLVGLAGALGIALELSTYPRSET